MLIMSLIAGIWTTACIQTQISNIKSGYVKETYTIQRNGSFEWKREWFTDSKCVFPNGTDSEAGLVVVRNRLKTLFFPGEIFEADFSTQSGIDLGSVAVKDNKLRVARGVSNSNMRNTMLSIFEYTKQ